jgi:hypothetical protein
MGRKPLLASNMSVTTTGTGGRDSRHGREATTQKHQDQEWLSPDAADRCR